MTNNEGYIVSEVGGHGPLDYGGSRKWFATYDDAERYARAVIAQGNSDEVTIWRGAKESLWKYHPTQDRLFFWVRPGVMWERFYDDCEKGW